MHLKECFLPQQQTPTMSKAETLLEKFLLIVVLSLSLCASHAGAQVRCMGCATLLLSATPTSISFGNVTVGNSSNQSVTLTNTGTGSVTVSQATVAGAGFSISGLSLPLTLTAGQSANFIAIFAPTTAGSASGSVSVASTATNSPAVVSLLGTGVTLLLSANPSSTNFGNIVCEAAARCR